MGDKTIKLLGISGSLRKDSFNTSILRTLQKAIVGKAELTLQLLNDLPVFSQDLEANMPAAVAAFHKSLAECDGVIISSPEYNHGMSGVIKNALDWASRPPGKSEFIGKPTLIMTASPAATGGARAQAQVFETVAALMANVLIRPQIVIPSVHEKIKDGHLTDERTLQFVVAGVDDLIKAISDR